MRINHAATRSQDAPTCAGYADPFAGLDDTPAAPIVGTGSMAGGMSGGLMARDMGAHAGGGVMVSGNAMAGSQVGSSN